MRIHHVFWLVLASQPVVTSAAEVAPERNTRIFPVTARDSALGGPQVGDSESSFANPAALGFLKQSQACAGGRTGLLERAGSLLGVSVDLGPWGAVQVGGSLETFGFQSQRNEYGAVTGTFESGQKSGILGYGISRGHLSMGLSGVWGQVAVSSSKETRTQTKIGVLGEKAGFTAGLTGDWAGGSGDHFGNLALGIGHAVKGPAATGKAFLSAETRQQARPLLRLGFEGIIADVLAFRVGYQGARGLGGFGGFRAGIGFKVKNIGVDYAFEPEGDLGDEHRVTLSYGFVPLIRTLTLTERVEKLLSQGRALQEEKNSTGAAAKFSRATGLDPKSKEAWHGLGYALYGQRDMAGAKMAFQKYLELAPDDVSMRTWVEGLAGY